MLTTTVGRLTKQLAPLALLLVMACSDDSTGPADPGSPEPVWSVAIEPGTIALTSGETRQLSARLQARDGSPLSGRTVTWSSSEPTVAAVSEAGIVRALLPGTTTLTALSEGRSGRATLRVSAARVPVAAVEIRPAGALTLAVGESAELEVVLRAADGSELSGRDVTWTAAPSANASVDASGVVLARRAGSVLITAASEGVAAQKSITVTASVLPVDRLEPTTAGVVTLLTGGTAQLGVRAYAADGTEITGRAVTWSSSNGAVATVAMNGVVAAHSVGSADVTAKLEGVQVTVAIDVRSLVTRIDLDAADVVLAPGEERVVRATARGEDGTILDRPLSWRSDDPAVARVDERGRIVAVATGGTVVRVTTEGVEGRVDVRVVEWVTRPLLTVGGLPVPDTLFTRIETGPDGEERRTVVEVRAGELELAVTGMNSGRYRQVFSVTITTDGGPPAVGQYGYGGTWQADVATGTLILNAWNGERLVARPLASGGLVVAGRLEPETPELELGYGTQ